MAMPTKKAVSNTLGKMADAGQIEKPERGQYQAKVSFIFSDKLSA